MTNKSREDWAQIIEEQKQSGQSIKSYCEEKCKGWGWLGAYEKMLGEYRSAA
jgi:hypothetical protein